MSAPSTSLESLLTDDLIDVKRELTPALLQQLSFFRSAHLSTAALASLIQVLGHRYLSIGDNVFRQGDPSTEFYVVLSGRVQFYREFLNSRGRSPRSSTCSTAPASNSARPSSSSAPPAGPPARPTCSS